MIVGGDADVTAKLVQLESEVSSKKQEINNLREQVRFSLGLKQTMISNKKWSLLVIPIILCINSAYGS